jgi:hypothetical protein
VQRREVAARGDRLGVIVAEDLSPDRVGALVLGRGFLIFARTRVDGAEVRVRGRGVAAVGAERLRREIARGDRLGDRVVVAILGEREPRAGAVQIDREGRGRAGGGVGGVGCVL